MPATTSLRLALFYVAIFVVFGVQVPFWPLWLGARGLSAEELGVLFAVGQWVKAAANPLAGMAADPSGEAQLRRAAAAERGGGRVSQLAHAPR